jgi:hemolysin activation/secretion protein
MAFAGALAVVVLSFWPVLANAVETADTEEQRNRAKQEAAERERQLHAPSVNLQGQAPPPSHVVALPLEAICFKMVKVSLEVPEQLPPKNRQLGASTLPSDNFRFAQDFLERYRDGCIGRQGINLIVQRLTEQILLKGYTTTRLGVPEQDLSSGTLKLTLIPGVIHQIRFADPSIKSRLNTFPSGPGDLLNLRDLEQGLEQMKRVTSQDVDMQIVPADTLGESDVVVTLKQAKPWKLTASLDDTGAKGTGKTQAGLNLGWDNLLDASDVFSIGVNSDGDRDSKNKGTQGYNTSYSIPFGYTTVSVSASDFQYHQRVVGLIQTFVSSGKSQNFESKIGYLFYRDQVMKDTLQFRVGRRWSHSYIDDTEITVQYRNTTFAELALIHKHYFGQTQLDVTGAYRWGVPWFGAQGDSTTLAGISPRFNYKLETIDATLSSPFGLLGKQLNYTATLRAQNANTPLYATEWFLIGNRWTVRGFDGENSLGAEKGFFLRNDLGIPISDTGQSAYIGFDFGKVFGPNTTNLIGDKLAGAALGLKGSFARGLSYDIFSGWPLYKPHGFRTAVPAAGFTLNFQI